MFDKIMVGYLKKNLTLDKNQEQVVSFAAQIIESTISSICGIVLVAWALGNIKETMVVLVTAGALRLAAGGAHCNSALRCTLTGAVVFPTLGLFSQHHQIQSYGVLVVLIVVSLISIAKYAPAEAPGKPLTNLAYIKKMYRISLFLAVFIAAVALFLYPEKNHISTGVVIGLVWQSLTITPVGYKLVGYVDKFFYILIRR